MTGVYEQGLEQCHANYSALSPLSLLSRTVSVYPNKAAVIYGSVRYDYATFYERCCRLSSAIKRRGIGTGDTVAVMAPNVPAVLEAHFGVPMAGAVLNALNIRLDAEAIAFQLTHGGARIVLVDPQYRSVIDVAVSRMDIAPLLIDIEDPNYDHTPDVGSGVSYEQLLAEGDPTDSWALPADEWQAITLNYTSGTTGNPKGVVFHHRGAYLESLGNVIALGLDDKSVYLWTLPMFHCNGWTFTWAVTAAGGTHICLRNTEPISVFEAIGVNSVTHLCGAPIVLNMLIHAPEDVKQRPKQLVRVATGGAAPPSTV
ncbi:MAG: AMP-binding protein, partial [Candidatus Latescibacteria bacterium]|nr:AMP-binding protein [Candidatus Latescibacterota bacterium]